jgi:FAD/FMN-containing dehydrogenase
VTPGKRFLREAILSVFRGAPCNAEDVPPLRSAGYRTLRRSIYRAQIGSKVGKGFRWEMEKTASARLKGKYFSRNQLLNEGADVYQEHNAGRTDILHEYFLPSDECAAFLRRVRAILPRYEVDLMNVTVRNVLEDKDTYMRYATGSRFAFVMLFNQPMTDQAKKQMQAATRDLIDAVLELGGCYYLPYRPHATVEQFDRAYPQAKEFFAKKRQHDPTEMFQNRFYARYGKRAD